jgi:hypothetical protein
VPSLPIVDGGDQLGNAIPDDMTPHGKLHSITINSTVLTAHLHMLYDVVRGIVPRRHI